MKTITSSRFTRGATLVEILIMVGIIGLLAGIAIPNFIKARKADQADREKAKAAEAAKLSNSVPTTVTPAKK